MNTRQEGSRETAFSFFNSASAAPLPGLAASAAGRLPRWALIGLLLLYVAHGLFYRDAWRGDDLVGLALARSTAEALADGRFQALLMPQLEGFVWNAQGPLWISIQALFMLPAILSAKATGSPIPLTLLDDLARLPVAVAMLLGLIAIWKASDRLARRREAQPIDPLGVGPRSEDFGKTLADCTLMLAVATLGVIYPWHQAGHAAVGFLLQSLLLWSLATAPEMPRRAGLQCGLIASASLLTQGIGLLMVQLISLGFVFRFTKAYRLVAAHYFAPLLTGLLSITAAWTLLALTALPAARIAGWWADGMSDWHLMRWFSVVGAADSIGSWLKAILWEWWPLWPIALYGLWKARRIKFSAAPHWMVPLLVTLTAMLVGLIGPAEWRVHKLIPVASLAILAGFCMLRLPRPLVNLIDWFAVTLFTALGIFIWLYWSALNFGFPETLARRVAILAPGVTGNANPYEILIGIAASLGWVALVAWRIRRGNPRLWRPVVLSAGGLTLLWVLLMTLWRPAIDRIQGEQLLARSLENGWINAAARRFDIPAAELRASVARNRQTPSRLAGLHERACVGLSGKQSLLDIVAVGLTGLPIADRPDCIWRLAQIETSSASNWKIVWQASSPEDRRNRERFILLERP